MHEHNPCRARRADASHVRIKPKPRHVVHDRRARAPSAASAPRSPSRYRSRWGCDWMVAKRRSITGSKGTYAIFRVRHRRAAAPWRARWTLPPMSVGCPAPSSTRRAHLHGAHRRRTREQRRRQLKLSGVTFTIPRMRGCSMTDGAGGRVACRSWRQMHSGVERASPRRADGSAAPQGHVIHDSRRGLDMKIGSLIARLPFLIIHRSPPTWLRTAEERQASCASVLITGWRHHGAAGFIGAERSDRAGRQGSRRAIGSRCRHASASRARGAPLATAMQEVGQFSVSVTLARSYAIDDGASLRRRRGCAVSSRKPSGAVLDLAPEEELLLVVADEDRTDGVGETPLGDIATCN